MERPSQVFIHERALVDSRAQIGAGTKVWVNAQIREGACIGEHCIVSKDVYIDMDVVLGSRCKIQNGVSIYQGVSLEDDVFVGPHVAFTNDRNPRANTPDWQITSTTIKRGASIGANATVVCGITLGEYCIVAAGSVVTRDVAPYAMVMGNPARFKYWVDKQGHRRPQS